MINEYTRFQVISYEVMRHGVRAGCEVSIISFHAQFFGPFFWVRKWDFHVPLSVNALFARMHSKAWASALHFWIVPYNFLFSNFCIIVKDFFINTFRIQVILLTVEWGKKKRKKDPVRIIKNTFLHNCWGANSQRQPICSTNHHRVLNGCSLICHSWAIKHRIFYADIWSFVVNFHHAAAAVYMR